MSPRLLKLLLRLAVSTLILLPSIALAADKDNKGTDFILGFLPNFDTAVTIEIHLTSDVPTDATVNYPINAPTFTTTVGVAPGAITIVTLPVQTSTGWSFGTAQDNLVGVTADEELVVYMVNRRAFTSDAALALPEDTFGSEFIVAGHPSTIVGVDRSEFAVYASVNSTTVTITPRRNLSTGQPAGVPFDISLNRGEGALFQGTSNGAGGDLTGTIISSDRKIGMTNGNKCANVPSVSGFCDHIFEVAQPTETWSDEVLVSSLPLRPSGSVYRIVASADGTRVQQDGVDIANLNSGDFFTTAMLPGNHIFSSPDSTDGDLPIFVAQFMTGSSTAPGPSRGDPAMGNMTPPEQFLSDYTFSTVGGNQFVEHFLTVIADSADVAGGTILLDGVAIPAGSFTPIGASGFSTAQVELADGTHTTSSSDGPHGITVEGYNADDSYLYPGGALFIVLDPDEENPPLCELDVFLGPPPFAQGSASDNNAAAEDSGIDRIVLEGDTNLALTVDPFLPPTFDLVNFSVDLVDLSQRGSGNVVVYDNFDNSCSLRVDLPGRMPPGVCDVDGDGDVDTLDVDIIFQSRGEIASGPDDPRDSNGDGIISVNDARECVLVCTLPNCVPTPTCGLIGIEPFLLLGYPLWRRLRGRGRA